MRKGNQKAYPSRVRSSRGQTTLQSFLFKPSVADGDLNLSPLPPPPPEDEDEIPNSPPAPPKREIVRVTNKTIKEKASAFSSVGSSSKSGSGGEAGGASALNAAVFRRFNGSSPPAGRAECSAEAGDDADDDGASGSGVRLDVDDIAAGCRGRESRRRESPHGGDGRMSSNGRNVVVLGDDPKPRPPPSTRRGRRGRGRGDNGLYNHYASGGGLWQGEQEGVDGEEVGWTEDMWEGMGSITLGGMEWH